jgi:hypothetical protein
MSQLLKVSGLIFLILFAVVAGCAEEVVDKAASTSGEGIITRDYTVETFDKIIISTSGDVILTQGSQQSVQIKADQKIIDDLDVSVNGNTLTIKEKKVILPGNTIVIQIKTPEFKAIGVKGIGNIRNNGTIKADSLDLSIEASGVIDLGLDVTDLSSSIEGSGKIGLSGTAENHDISISGSGTVKGYDLETNTTSVTILGSGEAQVMVQDTLNVDITGAGSIKYKGSPKITQNIKGSGLVTKTG